MEQERCSLIARQNEEPLRGTATYARCYLVMEVPTPWKRVVEYSPNVPVALTATLDRLADQGKPTRFQAILPDREYSKAGFTRVIYFESPDQLHTRMDKTEYHLPDEGLQLFLSTFFGEGEKSLQVFKRFKVLEDTRDILVCTHGSRDRCCALSGYPLYNELRAKAGKNTRVWRTSHIGGHRFAPGFIDLPTTRFWGNLDVETALAILNQTRPVEELLPYYRGLGLLPQFAQIAEAVLFGYYNWDWDNLERRMQTDQVNEEFWRVNFTVREPANTVIYPMTVQRSEKRTILGSCGDSLAEEITPYRLI